MTKTIRKNLVMMQGGRFERELEYLDDDGSLKDVTGLTAEAQFAKHFTSDEKYDLTTSLANGSVTLSMSSDETAEILRGKYWYDINITDQSNNVIKLYRGILRVVPGVTS